MEPPLSEFIKEYSIDALRKIEQKSPLVRERINTLKKIDSFLKKLPILENHNKVEEIPCVLKSPERVRLIISGPCMYQGCAEGLYNFWEMKNRSFNSLRRQGISYPPPKPEYYSKVNVLLSDCTVVSPYLNPEHYKLESTGGRHLELEAIEIQSIIDVEVLE